ncbi:MAG: (2E,6E)-farnesyl diphosphate synthase [Gammaproteobacteria bacterium]|nr:(2E,6E)-farnesyl diphosphate synthase [Gammaproteobacteria bacterium]
MISDYQHFCQTHVDGALEQLLRAPSSELERLYAAMRYSVMNGGKRVRPLLVFASCQALGGEIEQAYGAACAVELIHAYSLVHDDLPAMDDDDLRRGQPTTHKAFDEAYAILAGDALQSLAFYALADEQLSPVSCQQRLDMLKVLATAAGACGMVGGQAIDLSSVGKNISQDTLELMHRHKTGALIQASVRLGAIASNHASEQKLAALERYAQAIGLAFQVQDDILDVTSDTQTLGKQQGSDIQHNKPTYPALLGLEAAQDYANSLRDQAHEALADFDQHANYLRKLADYIVSRSN